MGQPESPEFQKADITVLEKAGLDETNTPSYDAQTKRIMRKVDVRLLPTLTLLYVLSFMDRSNIGNAKVAGMSKDLHLTDAQYNMSLTVFFFTYALFEVPSNIVLKLMRPSWWMTILVVTWGVVLTLQGIVHNYHELVVTRVLMGLAETGFFPASTYLLTTWYCRFEVQTRVAVFFSAASLAGAFSGLLAFAIQHMDGIAGLSGWRWIFILEGILTVVIGVTIPFMLPDSVSSVGWLTAEEKEIISRRLEQDTGTAAGRVGTTGAFQWRYLWSALSDWKVYLGSVIYIANCICIYGFSYTAPTIITQLGYTSAHAQLMTVPVYVVSAISTVFFAWMADRRKQRWLFIAIPLCITMVGFIGLISIPHPRLPGLTYFFLFFVPSGLYAAVVGCIAWLGNNLAPTWKRAIGMAMMLTVGNLGSAVGCNIFLARQAPHYYLGYGLCLGVMVAAIVSALAIRVTVGRINKVRDEMSEEEALRKYSEAELEEMGDKSPLFRYVY